MPSKQSKLDSGMQVDRQSLTAAVGSEEDQEVLGYAMMYSVGEILVPREWLLEECEELGIPDSLVPNEPRPSSAYKRAIGRLLSDKQLQQQQVRGHEVELELDSGSGNNEFLLAKVFFPEDEIGEEGGKWEYHTLGRFDYSSDSQQPDWSKDDDCPPGLDETWQEAVDRLLSLTEKMKTHHIDTDIRHIAYYLRLRETDSVIPLRDGGAVYFVPGGDLMDIVDSIKELYRRIDATWKDDGVVALRTLEIIDNEDRREWVQSRVEKALDSMVDDVLDEAFDSLQDDDTASDLVSTVMDNLGDAIETSEQYNSLLQSELDVAEELEKRKEDLEDEREELIENVLSQQSFEDF